MRPCVLQIQLLCFPLTSTLKLFCTKKSTTEQWKLVQTPGHAKLGGHRATRLLYPVQHVQYLNSIRLEISVICNKIHVDYRRIVIIN